MEKRKNENISQIAANAFLAPKNTRKPLIFWYF